MTTIIYRKYTKQIVLQNLRQFIYVYQNQHEKCMHTSDLVFFAFYCFTALNDRQCRGCFLFVDVFFLYFNAYFACSVFAGSAEVDVRWGGNLNSGYLCQEYLYQKSLNKSRNPFSSYNWQCRECFFETRCYSCVAEQKRKHRPSSWTSPERSTAPEPLLL